MVCLMYKVAGVPHFCHAILEDEKYVVPFAQQIFADMSTLVILPLKHTEEGFYRLDLEVPKVEDNPGS